MVGVGLVMGLIDNHTILRVGPGFVDLPRTVFKRTEERKQSSIRILIAPFLILLKDWLAWISMLLFEVDDGTNVLFRPAVEGDYLTAAREKGDTEQQMGNFLRRPVTLADKTIDHLSCK